MSTLENEAVLSLIPQQRPMRFVDEILELDEEHILGSYTWKKEDCEGYLSGTQIVPPFKLVEMAAQIGSVAWCIYHMRKNVSAAEIENLVGFFTEIRHCEYKNIVYPGDRVLCLASFGDEGYFRANKLVSQVEMQFDGGSKDGMEVFFGLVAGMWVPKNRAP